MLEQTDELIGAIFYVTSGTNVGQKYEYRGATAGWVQTHDASGAVRVTQNTLPGSENNYGSAALGFQASRGKRQPTVINQQTAVTLGSGVANDIMFGGVHISTALTGTCVITGFPGSSGAAVSITLPIGSVGWKDFGDIINTAGAFTVTCATPGDTLFVTVVWSNLL